MGVFFTNSTKGNLPVEWLGKIHVLWPGAQLDLARSTDFSVTIKGIKVLEWHHERPWWVARSTPDAENILVGNDSAEYGAKSHPPWPPKTELVKRCTIL